MTDELVDRVIRRQGWLDPLAAVVQRAVGKVYGILGTPDAAIRSAMHGTRIAGHALHPALTDLPVGAWIAGVVFDFVAHFTTARQIRHAHIHRVRHVYRHRGLYVRGVGLVCRRIQYRVPRSHVLIIRTHGL